MPVEILLREQVQRSSRANACRPRSADCGGRPPRGVRCPAAAGTRPRQRPGRIHAGRPRVRHHLEPGQTTPAPWANVIANPQFGTVVSESGGGYTWAENAHEFRLTTWHNDPVSDASGEAFYIRDEETGRFWSPTPLPAPRRSWLRVPARLRLQRLRAL